MNRIEKESKKPLKRRRPNKKLVTTLEGLADALPSLDDIGDLQDEAEKGKIKQKSFRTRPGATKRREKLERMERDRFGKNMAQMVAGSTQANTNSTTDSTQVEGGEGAQAQSSSTSSRWAALRGFITQTMEQKEEFKKA